MRVEAIRPARQGGGEVEPEARHPGLGRPVPQRIQHQPQRPGPVERQGIAAARVIGVAGAPVR